MPIKTTLGRLTLTDMEKSNTALTTRYPLSDACVNGRETEILTPSGGFASAREFANSNSEKLRVNRVGFI